jgi:hypothetical protein
MTDPNLIESKLCSTTNAMLVDRETKNNRFHYRLIFDENIGWDWFEKQVTKVQGELGVKIEPYKMKPVPASLMALEVRELERREGIDESQSDLAEFEA